MFDEEGMLAIKDELQDRFGKLPECVERLLELARLKADMTLWQLNSVIVEKPYLAFGYGDRQRAEQLVRKSNKRIRLVDESSLYTTIPQGMSNPDEIIALCRDLLSLST